MVASRSCYGHRGPDGRVNYPLVVLYLSLWLMLMGIVFLANAWVRPTIPTGRSWLARFRPFAWLEEVGLEGIRTQARLQRLAAYRAVWTVIGGAFLVAAVVALLINQAQ
jgi:hypothetical protein